MLNNSTIIKQQLYQLCNEYVNQKISSARQSIDEAQQAMAGETKSSAGDKYETSRAMIQQEIDRYTMQLNEAMKLKTMMNNIKADAAPSAIAIPGSLVVTSQGSFYLAVSAGNLVLGNQNFFAVSPASPVGLKLKGISVNSTFILNQKQYLVEEIY